MPTEFETISKFVFVYNETLEKVWKKYPKELFRIQMEQYNVVISLNNAGPFPPLCYVRKVMRDAGLYAKKQLDEDNNHWVMAIYISLTTSLFDHNFNKLNRKEDN